jgi:hypothetical protein
LNRIARNIWANNDRIDPNTAFDLALTVTSIKRPDPDGKYPTSKYNQQAGAGFTHFKPYSSSQRRHNTVLQVGPHLIQVPNDTYSDIRGLHGRNWQQYEGQKEKYDKQAEQDKLHGGTSPAKAITQGIITGLGQLPGAGPALAIGAEKVRRQFQED